jgi:hypothetical protein
MVRGIKCTKDVNGVDRYFANGKQISKESALRRMKKSGKKARCVKRTTPAKQTTPRRKSPRRKSPRRRMISTKNNVAKTEIFYPVVQGLDNVKGDIYAVKLSNGNTEEEAARLNIQMIAINTVDGNIYMSFRTYDGNSETMFIPFNKYKGFNKSIKTISFNTINNFVSIVFGDGEQLKDFTGQTMTIILRSEVAFKKMKNAFQKINKMLLSIYNKNMFFGKDLDSDIGDF